MEATEARELNSNEEKIIARIMDVITDKQEKYIREQLQQQPEEKVGVKSWFAMIFAYVLPYLMLGIVIANFVFPKVVFGTVEIVPALNNLLLFIIWFMATVGSFLSLLIAVFVGTDEKKMPLISAFTINFLKKKQKTLYGHFTKLLFIGVFVGLIAMGWVASVIACLVFVFVLFVFQTTISERVQKKLDEVEDAEVEPAEPTT